MATKSLVAAIDLDAGRRVSNGTWWRSVREMAFDRIALSNVEGRVLRAPGLSDDVSGSMT